MLGKDINSIHKILFPKGNKLEEDWNIISHEISENLKIEAIFEEIKKSLSYIIENSQFSDDIFSFTIIYSLDNIANENEPINRPTRAPGEYVYLFYVEKPRVSCYNRAQAARDAPNTRTIHCCRE